MEIEESLPSKIMNYSSLEKRIDFEHLFENAGENTNASTKLFNSLRLHNIITYLDLVEFCQNPIGEKWGSIIENKRREVSSYKLKRQLDKKEGKEYYFNALNLLRNTGKKSINLFISHLQEIGFDFSRDFAEKTIKKYHKETH